MEPRASCVLSKGCSSEPRPSPKGGYYIWKEVLVYFRVSLCCLCLKPQALLKCLNEGSAVKPELHPPLKLIFNIPNLLSSFLHDKNSREFLYYRKKVAEIRKEAQKPQAATQKGKWSEEGREHCGMWAAKTCALMGSRSCPVGGPTHLQVSQGPAEF